MLPKLEGIIARRILLNWWLEPEVARRLVPPPFEPAIVNGFAVGGICLIRLEQVRPAGMPAALGIASENMAHRIAVRYPGADGPSSADGGLRMNWKDGVYILRRDTGSLVNTLLGGRVFPGVHYDAEFQISEKESALSLHVLSNDGSTDVRLRALTGVPWKWSLLFPRLADASAFFERGSRGFSCRLDGGGVEGVELRQQHWEMSPLAVEEVHSAFFDNEKRFPRGSAGFDSAVIMRGIPHTWHELQEVPELVGTES